MPIGTLYTDPDIYGVIIGRARPSLTGGSTIR